MHPGNSQSPESDGQTMPAAKEPSNNGQEVLLDCLKESIRKTKKANKDRLMSLLQQHEVSAI